MTGVQIEQHIASQPAAISDAVVRILSEHTGRGPTGVRTTIRDGLVLVVLRDTMTRGERSLLAAGHHELVREERAAHQTDMHDDLIAAVEGIAGRTVEALMSASHVDPDMAVEIFVLA
jgi:uncharacterized protein YbcI